MARILIIDDDPDVRFDVREVLEEAGHDISEAADGAQGLVAQDTDPADLVLCDIFMPGMEGLETMRRLRGRHPATPIIAMSAGSDAVPGDYLDVAQRLGAVMVLRKHLDLEPANLTRAVAAALRRVP